MIGVANKRIEAAVEHFREARAGKTRSKRLLGVMNDQAFRCGAEVDGASRSSPVSLSDLELRMANMPQATLGFRAAREVALDLLKSQAKLELSDMSADSAGPLRCLRTNWDCHVVIVAPERRRASASDEGVTIPPTLVQS